jgi:hypothetical protein
LDDVERMIYESLKWILSGKKANIWEELASVIKKNEILRASWRQRASKWYKPKYLKLNTDLYYLIRDSWVTNSTDRQEYRFSVVLQLVECYQFSICLKSELNSGQNFQHENIRLPSAPNRKQRHFSCVRNVFLKLRNRIEARPDTCVRLREKPVFQICPTVWIFTRYYTE